MTLPNAERVLFAVGSLALFTLNDVRLFQSLPRAPDPGSGQTHALAMQLMGASEPVYAATLDLASRWGLAGLVMGLSIWALAETIGPQQERRGDSGPQ